MYMTAYIKCIHTRPAYIHGPVYIHETDPKHPISIDLYPQITSKKDFTTYIHMEKRLLVKNPISMWTL